VEKVFALAGVPSGAGPQESPEGFTDSRGSPVALWPAGYERVLHCSPLFEERCLELMLLCVGIADSCEPAGRL
jgi:hypothetical protein